LKGHQLNSFSVLDFVNYLIDIWLLGVGILPPPFEDRIYLLPYWIGVKPEVLFLFANDLLADPAILACVLDLVFVLNSFHILLHIKPEYSFFFADCKFELMPE
jgi:hypothetical protein